MFRTLTTCGGYTVRTALGIYTCMPALYVFVFPCVSKYFHRIRACSHACVLCLASHAYLSPQTSEFPFSYVLLFLCVSLYSHVFRSFPACSCTDSPGWAKKKQKFPSFFKDPRNIILVGCADGVNPWKKLGAGSCFVVVFVNMNLPADIRMKRENLVLLGITDKKPKDSRLVFDLVVDDLCELWAGVPCWDASVDKQFKLRAMMICGLCDYPGLTDACCQVDEGSFKSCVKCTQQGYYVKALKKCKYSLAGHGKGHNEGRHDIRVETETHEGLLTMATDMEVRSPKNTQEHARTTWNCLQKIKLCFYVSIGIYNISYVCRTISNEGGLPHN